MGTDKLATLASEQQIDITAVHPLFTLLRLTRTCSLLLDNNKHYLNPLMYLSIPLFWFEFVLPAIQLISINNELHNAATLV